jgi:hypothetical protein
MKTIILNSLISVTIMMLLTGCYTSVFVEKDLPPVIETTMTNPTAAFINRYDYTLPGAVREKYRDCYWLGASEICKNIKEDFGQSDLLKVITVDTLLPGIACSSPGMPISPDTVVDKCRKYNTSFLIVLESLNFWITGEKEGDKMQLVKWQDVYLDLRAGISLYSSTGNLLHLDSITYRILYRTRLSLTADVWLFEPSLLKSGPSIILLAKDISEEYYKKLQPQTLQEQKTLFAGKGFSEVRKCFAQEDWNEAIRLLMPLADSPDQKLAKEAAYDLSVMYEIKGNMAQSDFWRNKSGGKKPSGVISF